MKKRTLPIILLLLAALLLITGCAGTAKPSGGASGGGDASERKIKDTVTIALYGDPPTLDPQREISDPARVIEWGIYDRLVTKDADGNILPELATKWEMVDELTLRFFLRDDVYFHNGEKLTAEDVRFSIDRATESWGSAWFMSSFDGPGCAVIDDLTVDIKFKTPFAPALNYLASSRGAILCKSAVESMGDEAYGAAPVGTGPLVFDSHIKGDSVVCVRNENYWGEKTSFSKIIYRVIPEVSARAIELESGGVDVALGLTATEMSRIEANPKTELIITPSYESFYIGIASVTKAEEAPYMKDIRFRQALAYALDTPSIVKSVWGETASPADSIIVPTIPGYYPSGPHEYNPEKAKQLLNEMGFDFNTTIPFATISGNRVLMETAEIVQNMWSAIGLKVELTLYEEAALYDAMYAAELSTYLINDPPQSGDSDHALMLWADSGSGVLDDPEILALIDKGRSTFDPEARKAIYEDISQRLWDYHATVQIAFGSNIYGIRQGVENFDVRPAGIPNCSSLIVYED